MYSIPQFNYYTVGLITNLLPILSVIAGKCGLLSGKLLSPILSVRHPIFEILVD